MLIISPKILMKIGNADHGSVTERDVRECFMSRCGRVVVDDREQHATQQGLQTMWFVGETRLGRKLKIVYVEDGENVYLKSAYLATDEIQALFNRRAV